MPSRAIAASFALAGFATACVSGLAAGRDAVSTVGVSLFCLVICYAIGQALGLVGERVVLEASAKYRADNPVPRVPTRDEILAEAEGANGTMTVEESKVSAQGD